MDTVEFYMVYKPTPESEKVDIFNGSSTTLKSLYDQFLGGLKPEMIHGVFTKKSEAIKEAELLYNELLKTRNEKKPFSLPTKERFKKFILALEALSTDYGVAIQSTGGVIILKAKKAVLYSKDHTSGDLIAYC